MKRLHVKPTLERGYSTVNGVQSWQVDELDDFNREAPLFATSQNSQFPYRSDEKLTGLYFVNDPSNSSISCPSTINSLPNSLGLGGSYPQVHTQRWGFNDLQRRQDDLCFLITTPCYFTHSGVFDILADVKQIPLPKGGH